MLGIHHIIFLKVVQSSERDNSRFVDGIYLDASGSMLSLWYDFHHTYFGLVYNTTGTKAKSGL